MADDLTKIMIPNEGEKLDLILLAIQRLQEDLHMTKCEIKTAIREVSLDQRISNDLLIKLRVVLYDIDARLHGIELHQNRQNSST